MILRAAQGLILFSCLLLATAAQAEKVVLQLKWEHEFQFAGYYAALWQGYYKDEGLDVDIRPASTPDGRLLSPVDELVSGRADFAIGALDILVHRDRGVPLVVLAPIFQRSPNSIFALPGVPLASLDDLAQLTIASPTDDFTRAEVQALFSAAGIRDTGAHFVDRPPTIESLLSGESQAIATYGISARHAAREQGVALQELSPQSFGLDFYGDTLYTHQRVIEQSPERVRRFLRASLRGWEYALSHRQEIAARIARELPRHLFSYQDLLAYNLAFADVIDSYMAYPYTEIGHNNVLRWQHMVSLLRSVGVLEHDLDISRLVFEGSPRRTGGTPFSLLFLVVAGLFLLFGIYFSWQARYIWVLHVITILLIGSSVRFLEVELQKDYRARLEVAVLQQLNSLAARLSGEINRNIAYVSGMAAHIASNPYIDQQGFSRYGRAIFSEMPLLRNLAAAPDMVVRMVYPLEGNQAALGLDYQRDPRQKAVALRVRDSGRLAVAGPLTLVQGGKAFVIRTGVQARDEDGHPYFWGLLSAPLMVEDLYAAAGLMSPELSIDIAIRGEDALGASGEVFFGRPALFEDGRTLKATIRVGDGAWQLAAAPRTGWDYQGMNLVIVRGSGLLLLLLLLGLLIWRQRQLEARGRVTSQLRENEGLLREMSRVALINGWRLAVDGRSLHWSSSTCSALGSTDPHRLGSVDLLLAQFDVQEREKLQLALEAAHSSGTSFDLELALEPRGGERRWLRCIGTAHWTTTGWEVTGAIQDISERKRFSEVVERQASSDLLTGLPNRSAFYETLHWSLLDARRNASELALLFIDLDRFKPVNDSYGHAVGDQLLQGVAERIRACLREADTVARISGDEFTVILRDLGNEYAPIEVAERVLAAIRQPYDLGGRQVFCGASIGIAMYPADGEQADELISKADHAMYEVKKSGRNGCKYFTRSMQERSEQRHNLYLRLQAAIANRELTVEYQPLVDLRSGSISRCEALVRWYDADGKSIPASEFIAMAEETSLVNDIDYFVLEQATAFIEALSERLGQPVGLSLNLSPRLFVSTDTALHHWLELALAAARRVPLTVEVTERMLIEGPERAQQVLDSLKRGGATIAIDDFGTGYSSLSYLTRLPIDYLKIDRSFIQHMHDSGSAQMLVDTIISLAKNLGLELVAEGVETPEQLEALRGKGCDYVQGFLLARPMAGDELENWLRERIETD